MESDPDDLAALLSSVGGRTVFGAYMDDELIGFGGAEPTDDGRVEIALGLRPDRTGCELGLGYVNEWVAFVRDLHPGRQIFLTCATFNKRAIRTYERAGFTHSKTFMRETNGGNWEFAEMGQSKDGHP